MLLLVLEFSTVVIVCSYLFWWRSKIISRCGRCWMGVRFIDWSRFNFENHMLSFWPIPLGIQNGYYCKISFIFFTDEFWRFIWTKKVHRLFSPFLFAGYNYNKILVFKSLLPILFRPLGFLVPKDFIITWLLNTLALSVPGEGCSRNASYQLNLLSTFYYYHWVDISAGGILVSEGITRLVVSALALTWFIRYIVLKFTVHKSWNYY